MNELNASWPALLALGAGHGLNPAMGWLFAVALGLQRESRRAVWAALGPLAAGHALAIGATVVAVAFAGLVIPIDLLRWATAGSLIGLGAFRLVRSRHPRYGGMQAGAAELATWSFLMATAHGAGLMVLPLVMPSAAPGATMHHHLSAGMVGISDQWGGAWAALVHTAGYLVVTGVLAVIVYEKLGLRFLRKAWLNFDLVWSGALILTGVAMIVV